MKINMKFVGKYFILPLLKSKAYNWFVNLFIPLRVAIRNWWWRHFNIKHLNSRIKEADKLFKLTGRQQFVIAQTRTKLTVVNSDYVKAYNKLGKHMNVRKMDGVLLRKQAYYITPTGTTNKR